MFQPQTILTALQNAPFEYVVIGGIAANLHGSTRVTLDFDICIDFAPTNLVALSNLLAPYHPVHRISADKPAFKIAPDNAKGWKNLYLSTDIGVIDIIGDVKGIGHFSEVMKYSEIADFGGTQCRILSIDGLILAKEAVGREKDKEVIYQLRWIKEMQEKKQ